MSLQHRFRPLASSLVMRSTWPVFIDAGVAACGLAIFFTIVHMGAYWMQAPIPVVPISHSIRALPAYAAES